MISSAVIDLRFLVQVIDEKLIAYVPVTIHQRKKDKTLIFNPSDVRYLVVDSTSHLVPLEENQEKVKELLKRSI
jgi:hypothetical protein